MGSKEAIDSFLQARESPATLQSTEFLGRLKFRLAQQLYLLDEDGGRQLVMLGIVEGQGMILMSPEKTLRIAGVDSISTLTLIDNNEAEAFPDDTPILHEGDLLSIHLPQDTIFLQEKPPSQRASSDRPLEAICRFIIKVATPETPIAAEHALLFPEKPENTGHSIKRCFELIHRLFSQKGTNLVMKYIKMIDISGSTLGIVCKNMRGKLIVVDVKEGSAANLAGVKKDSILVTVQGRDVRSPEQLRSLVDELKATHDIIEMGVLPPQKEDRESVSPQSMQATPAFPPAPTYIVQTPPELGIFTMPQYAVLAYTPRPTDTPQHAANILQLHQGLTIHCKGSGLHDSTPDAILLSSAPSLPGSINYRPPCDVSDDPPSQIPALSVDSLVRAIEGMVQKIVNASQERPDNVPDQFLTIFLIGRPEETNTGFETSIQHSSILYVKQLMALLAPLPKNAHVTVVCDTDSCLSIMYNEKTPAVQLACKVAFVGTSLSNTDAKRRKGHLPSGTLSNAYMAAHGNGLSSQVLHLLGAAMPKESRTLVATNYAFAEVDIDSQLHSGTGWWKFETAAWDWQRGDLEQFMNEFYRTAAPSRAESALIDKAVEGYQGREAHLARDLFSIYLRPHASEADIAFAVSEMQQVLSQPNTRDNQARLRGALKLVTTPQAWQTVIEDYENRSGGDLTEALAAMYPGEVLLRNVVCPLACRGISYSPEDSMHTLSRKTSIMTNVSAAPAPPPGFVVDKDEFERFQEWRKGGGQNPNFRSHIGTVSTVSSSPSSSSSSSSSSSGTTNQPSLVPSNTGVVAISLINQSGQDTNKSPPGPPSFGRSRSPARRKNPSHPRTRVEQTHQPAHSTTSDVSPTGRSAKTNFVDAAREYVSSADRSEKERSMLQLLAEDIISAENLLSSQPESPGNRLSPPAPPLDQRAAPSPTPTPAPPAPPQPHLYRPQDDVMRQQNGNAQFGQPALSPGTTYPPQSPPFQTQRPHNPMNERYAPVQTGPPPAQMVPGDQVVVFTNPQAAPQQHPAYASPPQAVAPSAQTQYVYLSGPPQQTPIQFYSPQRSVPTFPSPPREQPFTPTLPYPFDTTLSGQYTATPPSYALLGGRVQNDVGHPPTHLYDALSPKKRRDGKKNVTIQRTPPTPAEGEDPNGSVVSMADDALKENGGRGVRQGNSLLMVTPASIPRSLTMNMDVSDKRNNRFPGGPGTLSGPEL